MSAKQPMYKKKGDTQADQEETKGDAPRIGTRGGNRGGQEGGDRPKTAGGDQQARRGGDARPHY